jgi:hypothetical protein
MILAYTPQLVDDMARRQNLPLEEGRLELVAATLTHVRTFIKTLEGEGNTGPARTEGAADEPL